MHFIDTIQGIPPNEIKFKALNQENKMSVPEVFEGFNNIQKLRKLRKFFIFITSELKVLHNAPLGRKF